MLTLAVLLLTSPALAAECYRSEDNPAWTITVNAPGAEPEMLWKQGEAIVELGTMGAGTGISRRVAYDLNGNSDDTYFFLFHAGDLIFDWSVYDPGCD